MLKINFGKKWLKWQMVVDFVGYPLKSTTFCILLGGDAIPTPIQLGPAWMDASDDLHMFKLLFSRIDQHSYKKSTFLKR